MNEAASTRFDQGRELSCVISLFPSDLAVRRSIDGGWLAFDDLPDMVAGA